MGNSPPWKLSAWDEQARDKVDVDHCKSPPAAKKRTIPTQSDSQQMRRRRLSHCGMSWWPAGTKREPWRSVQQSLGTTESTKSDFTLSRNFHIYWVWFQILEVFWCSGPRSSHQKKSYLVLLHVILFPYVFHMWKPGFPACPYGQALQPSRNSYEIQI